MENFKELLALKDPSAIIRGLYERGELETVSPELLALDINDHQSHKHKNNFFHSLKVLDQAIEAEGASVDIILRTAALFHDIGKPATRKFEGGDVTFQQHETVGARMMKRILKPQGYSNGEIALIEELIANHMRSFGYTVELWTDSAVRRFTSDISTPEQMARLLSLFKADVTTKNTSFRNKLHSNVDALERRIAEVKAADELLKRRPAINGNELMELFDLKPGKELGALMKFLNTEEGLLLSREQALEQVEALLKS